MNPGARLSALANQKVARSISILLVFLMMACGIMTIGNLVQSLVPGPYAGIIAGSMLFVVVERLYTYRHSKSLSFLSKEWAISLGTQWLVIALLIRLVYAYVDGFDVFLTDLSLFARGDLERLFTLEFVITLLFAFLAWALPAQFMGLLDEMGLDQELALRQASLPIQNDAVPPRQRLVNLTFGAGIILAVLAALTRVDLRATFADSSGFPQVTLNRLSGVEAGALLYFVFGLALLSLGRLMSLQTQWNQQRIPVSSQNLARQWGLYSLLFLLSLAVVVSLLPAGDSLGLFAVLGALLRFLFGVIAFIGQWIAVLVILLFSLPFFFMRKEPPLMESLPDPSRLTNLPEVAASPAVPSEIWTLIRSILLWGSLLAIIIFSIVQFVKQHESILTAVRQSRIANWLALAWQWLYRNAGKTRDSLGRTLADGWQRLVARLEGKRILSRPGFISLRSLDPRRQIYFFYLAMIRRGGEQGVPRKPSQTPAEYAATLEKALPSAEEDIDSITKVFMEARYSQRSVEAGEARLVKSLWERIRRALQSKSKSEPPAEK
jgi:hypothetical protein